MTKNIILTFLLFTTICSYSQSPNQIQLQNVVSEKGIHCIDFLVTYIKKQDLLSSAKAVKLIDTTLQLIEQLNQDSLKISLETFDIIKKGLPFFKEQDYKKILADEKKSPKERVKLENGEIIQMSKNNFMTLYSLLRIVKNALKEWQTKLQE